MTLSIYYFVVLYGIKTGIMLCRGEQTASYRKAAYGRHPGSRHLARSRDPQIVRPCAGPETGLELEENASFSRISSRATTTSAAVTEAVAAAPMAEIFQVLQGSENMRADVVAHNRAIFERYDGPTGCRDEAWVDLMWEGRPVGSCFGDLWFRVSVVAQGCAGSSTVRRRGRGTGRASRLAGGWLGRRLRGMNAEVRGGRSMLPRVTLSTWAVLVREPTLTRRDAAMSVFRLEPFGDPVRELNRLDVHGCRRDTRPARDAAGRRPWR